MHIVKSRKGLYDNDFPYDDEKYGDDNDDDNDNDDENKDDKKDNDCFSFKFSKLQKCVRMFDIKHSVEGVHLCLKY